MTGPGSGACCSNRGVLVFSPCAALFTLANAAMLPLAGNEITQRGGQQRQHHHRRLHRRAAGRGRLISPAVGHLADRWGRRLVLVLGFSALPLRGVLLA